MRCDVGEATEGLENKLWPRWNDGKAFSNLSVSSPRSQLILQPFHRFTYVTAHSPTLPLLHLRHSSFSNPSFASSTSQALHLASRPCITQHIGSSLATQSRTSGPSKTDLRSNIKTKVISHLDYMLYGILITSLKWKVMRRHTIKI